MIGKVTISTIDHNFAVYMQPSQPTKSANIMQQYIHEFLIDDVFCEDCDQPYLILSLHGRPTLPNVHVHCV